MKIWLMVILVVLAGAVHAGQTTFTWTFNAVDCDGVAVNAADYTNIEIYLDTAPIPAADAGCVQDGAAVDVPAASTTIVANAQDNAATANIPAGHYFVRGRVMLDGEWSQLSPQTERDIGRSPMVIQIGL